MQNFRLAEIIEFMKDNWMECEKSLLIDCILPYRRSLSTYFRNYFNQDPVLMVTAVFNRVQYGIIVPSNELHEAIEAYLDSEGIEDQEERESAYEVICANSAIL